MAKNKFYAIIIMCLLIVSPSVFAVDNNEKGFFSKIWNFFSDLFVDKQESLNATELYDINFQFDNQTILLNISQINAVLDKNEDIKGIIKKLNNDCYFLTIKKDNKLLLNSTFVFDNSFNIQNIYKENVCKNYITIDEKLLIEIKDNGFDKSKIMDYKSNFEANMGLYMDLVKLI